MPPFREERRVDRGLPGKALETLERSGHLRRMAIVDTSYPIPRWAEEVDYRGRSSADALLGVVRLVPVEGVVEFMSPDPDDNREEAKEALKAFNQAFVELESEIPELQDQVGERHRLDDDEPEGVGFYSLANDPHADTLFLRTGDRLPYACATFVIGHSQVPEAALEDGERAEAFLGYAFYRELAEFAEAHPDYDRRRGPKQLWNTLAKVSGAAWNQREVDISERGRITVDEEQLEVFKLASPSVRVDFGNQDPEPAAALNLDTLSILVDRNILLSMPNIGKKIASFAEDFLAARKLELEQRNTD